MRVRTITPRDVLVTNFVIVCPTCKKESTKESIHAPHDEIFGADLETFTCEWCHTLANLSVGTRDLLRWS